MDCCICIDDIPENSYISILPCGHLFHAICYSNYNGYMCPLCRSPNIGGKIDTLMYHKKSLFEWTNDDISSYISFLEENKELIKSKKKDMDTYLENKRREEISMHIRSFYEKNLNQIRYNIIKSITKNHNSFTVLYLKYGEIHEDYPLIFLIKGPSNEKDYFKDRNIKSFLEYINEDFPIFNFTIKSNNYSMCYEIKAKKK